MPGTFGGISQQVTDNIFELGQSAVKGVVKACEDLTKDTIETILAAPGSVTGQQSGDKSAETGQSSAKQQQAAAKKQAEKRQYEAVKNEMATYIQRKQQQNEQIARETADETQQKNDKEVMEKRKKESFVQQLMQRVAGGTHGETSKQKE